MANVLKSWVRDYMDHESVDAGLLRRIAAFATNTMQDSVQSLQINKAVEERVSRLQTPQSPVADIEASSSLESPLAKREILPLALCRLQSSPVAFESFA